MRRQIQHRRPTPLRHLRRNPRRQWRHHHFLLRLPLRQQLQGHRRHPEILTHRVLQRQLLRRPQLKLALQRRINRHRRRPVHLRPDHRIIPHTLDPMAVRKLEKPVRIHPRHQLHFPIRHARPVRLRQRHFPANLPVNHRRRTHHRTVQNRLHLHLRPRRPYQIRSRILLHLRRTTRISRILPRQRVTLHRRTRQHRQLKRQTLCPPSRRHRHKPRLHRRNPQRKPALVRLHLHRRIRQHRFLHDLSIRQSHPQRHPIRLALHRHLNPHRIPRRHRLRPIHHPNLPGPRITNIRQRRKHSRHQSRHGPRPERKQTSQHHQPSHRRHRRPTRPPPTQLLPRTDLAHITNRITHHRIQQLPRRSLPGLPGKLHRRRYPFLHLRMLQLKPTRHRRQRQPTTQRPHQKPPARQYRHH